MVSKTEIARFERQVQVVPGVVGGTSEKFVVPYDSARLVSLFVGFTADANVANRAINLTIKFRDMDKLMVLTGQDAVTASVGHTYNFLAGVGAMENDFATVFIIPLPAGGVLLGRNDTVQVVFFAAEAGDVTSDVVMQFEDVKIL